MKIKMNQREHYRSFVHFEADIKPPNIDCGPLLATYERWLKEGLNPGLDPRRYDEWCDAFGLSRWPQMLSYTPPRTPLFEEMVVEETETTLTIRRSDGSIVQDNKGAHKTIPHEIRPAVTTREEWERIKAWMNVEAALPSAEVSALAMTFQKAREATQPVWIVAGSMVGQIRNLLGFEEFAMKPYDDPEWFEDMVETFCRAAEWQVRLFGENRVPVDGVHFWEDICFKNGPILSPSFFTRYAVPRYRRVTSLAKSYGYDCIPVDSDGNIHALLDLWLDGGVNMFLPIEVQAGMDINVLQAQYHGRAVWLGGIHKYRLTGGERAIIKELRRVEPAMQRGGYVPACDHNVPMDVSFENYLTYLRLRQEILGLGEPSLDLARVRA